MFTITLKFVWPKFELIWKWSQNVFSGFYITIFNYLYILLKILAIRSRDTVLANDYYLLHFFGKITKKKCKKPNILKIKYELKQFYVPIIMFY